MSDVKTSEHFHGQDEYHRAYFHDIDAPAPLDPDRVDPNLPAGVKVEVVDPDLPSAPEKSGREESDEKPKSTKSGRASGSTK